MGAITVNKDLKALYGDMVATIQYNEIAKGFDWSKVLKVEIKGIESNYIIGGQIDFGSYGEQPLERFYITNYNTNVSLYGNANPDNHYSSIIVTLDGWDLPVINQYLNNYALNKIAADGVLEVTKQGDVTDEAFEAFKTHIYITYIKTEQPPQYTKTLAEIEQIENFDYSKVISAELTGDTIFVILGQGTQGTVTFIRTGDAPAGPPEKAHIDNSNGIYSLIAGWANKSQTIITNQDWEEFKTLANPYINEYILQELEKYGSIEVYSSESSTHFLIDNFKNQLVLTYTD